MEQTKTVNIVYVIKSTLLSSQNTCPIFWIQLFAYIISTCDILHSLPWFHVNFCIRSIFIEIIASTLLTKKKCFLLEANSIRWHYYCHCIKVNWRCAWYCSIFKIDARIVSFDVNSLLFFFYSNRCFSFVCDFGRWGLFSPEHFQ